MSDINLVGWHFYLFLLGAYPLVRNTGQELGLEKQIMSGIYLDKI